MDEIKNRLSKAMSVRGIVPKDLSEKTGIPKSSISQYMSGYAKPKQDRIYLIAKALDVSETWLLGYDVPMDRSPAPAADPLPDYPNIFPLESKKYPLLGEIACGEPIFANEDLESYIMSGVAINADFCLKAKGDSMTGARIMDGDIVFIKKDVDIEDGQIYAVIIDDEATLKRVYYDRIHNYMQLCPENPAYKPLVYVGEMLDHIKILGKAVAFQSDVR